MPRRRRYKARQDFAIKTINLKSDVIVRDGLKGLERELTEAPLVLARHSRLK